jgi:hypothetical protein
MFCNEEDVKGGGLDYFNYVTEISDAQSNCTHEGLLDPHRN